MIERKIIVAAARGWHGTPYHHQASVKGVGCDCLGLIRGVWREIYGPEPEAMPAYTRDWGNATGSETLIKEWWENRHYNRPGGMESGSHTAWVPESKPIWFTEVGCPAVDKGANQPNVFIDPKSSESFAPYFSRSVRDDLIQRRTWLEWGAGADTQTWLGDGAGSSDRDQTGLVGTCWA